MILLALHLPKNRKQSHGVPRQGQGDRRAKPKVVYINRGQLNLIAVNIVNREGEKIMTAKIMDGKEISRRSVKSGGIVQRN
jgi:hypothetical protein